MEKIKLSIAARVALRDYCRSTPKNERSFSSFSSKYPNISEEEYKVGIELFKNTDYMPGNATPVVPSVKPTVTKPEIQKPKIDKEVSPKKVEEPKVRPAEEKKDVKSIDGFEISTAKTFKISVPYVKRRYDEFNEKYFENKLPSVPIRLSKTKNYAGCYIWKWSYAMSKICEHVLEVSVFMQRSEESFCNTLLHEMIHVYQANVLHVDVRQMKRWAYAHGMTFTRKMDEINKYGWDISLRVTKAELESAEVSIEQVNKLKRSGRVLVYVNNSFLACIPGDTIEYYKRSYTRCTLKFYNIIDYAHFALYPMCRTSLRGKGLLPQDLQIMVDKGMISPMDSLNESLHRAEDLDIYDGSDPIVIDNGDVVECIVV